MTSPARTSTPRFPHGRTLRAYARNTLIAGIAGTALIGGSLPAASAAAVNAPGTPRRFVAVTECVNQAEGSDVVVSSGDASGKGWYVPEGSACVLGGVPVTVQLEEELSGTWTNEGKAVTKDLYASGSGDAITAAAACSDGTAKTDWRSHITVDGSGENIDTTTAAVDIAGRT